MKSIALVLGAILALGLAVPVFAGGPSNDATASVFCIGNVCGGSGTRNYEYELSNSSVDVNVFRVSTCDTNANHYTNWLEPVGWSHEIQPITDLHNPTFVSHGTTIGSDGICGWSVVWSSSTGNEVRSGLFGFDNPLSPHEVSWEINATALIENWGAPVGMGECPVHGPLPEPASVLSLGSGLIGLVGLVLRRRR